jgi:flagellar biosynthesis protein
VYSRGIVWRKRGYEKAPKQPQAAALAYDPQKDVAPRLLAAGQGAMAERIIAIARQNGITIRQEPLLVAALCTLDIGSVIPPQLYPLVAEVLAYVYRLQKRSL